MPDKNGGEKDILVYSWKPLWIYWPVYLALALAQETLRALFGVVFRLDHPDDAVTDVTIRAAFGAAITSNPGKPVVALCEPGAVPGTRPEQLLRIPVIWRMPHWLIASHPGTEIEALWCYPEKTTSGDYARKLIGAGVIRAQRTPALQDQNSTFLREQSLDRAGSLTFTPSHLWNPGLHARLFPGPDRDITALLIPVAAQIPNGEDLADVIRVNFQRVMQGLGTTHGDLRLVKEFIERYQPRVEPFYGSHEHPSPPDELAKALAEYLCHGCYFPYNVVRSALDGELRSITADALALAEETAKKTITEKITKLLGEERDWSTLAFSERQNVWRSAQDQYDNGLHVRITHAGPEDLPAILTGTGVSLAPSGLRMSVGSLNFKGRPLLCALRGNERCLAGLPEEKSSPDGQDHDPCFGCTVGGLVMPVLRSAATRVKTALGGSVTYGTCITGKDPQSILCWEDVSELVSLYCREGKSRSGSPDYHVTLCPTDTGAFSFSILWKGVPDVGGRPGVATQTMTSWASSHSLARRQVVAAGFWRKPNYELIFPPEAPPRSVCSCHHEYNFGYVVFFDPAGGAP